MRDSSLPRLGADTIRSRAARANQIWEGRQRARRGVVDEFETVDDPDRVGIEHRGGGLAPSREFLDYQQPREAAHRLDDQFPHQELTHADVEHADGGFRATETARRRETAFEFEAETDLEQVDPFGDLVPMDGAFGLAEQPQRELAAHDLDAQFPEVDLGPDHVQRVDDGFGLTQGAEREIAAERLAADTPLDTVDPDDDIRRTDDGFELRESVIEDNIGLFR